MPKTLTMLEVDNLKDRNETSFETRPLTKQECRNLIRTIEAKQEDIGRLNDEMKCPQCGYESSYVNWSKAFADAIEKRLVDYGQPVKMNPEKYRIYLAVRTTIILKYEIKAKPKEMTEEDYKKAMAGMDEILPPRT